MDGSPAATLAVVVVNYGSSELLRHNLLPLSQALEGALTIVVDSFSSGGISKILCVRFTAKRSSDSSGIPGTSAGPESPPFNVASRESSRSPPSALSGP